MPLTFNTPHETRPFTAHKEKDYPYFSYIYTIEVFKKTILYQTPLKLSIFHFTPSFLQLFKLLITKLYFLPILTHSLINVSILPLISSKYIKIIKPNLIVVLSVFKLSLIIPPSSTQDTLKSPQLILNPSLTKVMM